MRGYERLHLLRPLADVSPVLYGCFERRADALMELTDALLTAGPVLSRPPESGSGTSSRLGQPVCGPGKGRHQQHCPA